MLRKNRPSISVDRSPISIYRSAKLIYHHSPRSPEDDSSEQSKSESPEKKFEHHSCKLFFYQIAIIVVHLLIGPSILFVVMRLILLLILVLISFLVEPLIGRIGDFFLIVLNFELLIRQHSIGLVYQFELFICVGIYIRMVQLSQFIVLLFDLVLVGLFTES